jgi:hypothetical protein
VTFDLVFRGCMIAFAASYGFALVWALRSGRWPEAGRLYGRAEAPLAYWRELGLAGFRVLAAVTALLFMPHAVEGAREPPYTPVILLIILVPLLIRAFWTGEILFGSNRWSRRETSYWVMVVIGLLIVVPMAFILIFDLARG